MKRTIGAVVLLLAVTGGCLLSFFTQRQYFEEMIALAETAEMRYRAGDTDGAMRAADELAATFQKHAKSMALVLPHEALTEAEKGIVGLTLILPYGEPKDFTAEARRCRLLLKRLWDQERPTWENVL